MAITKRWVIRNKKTGNVRVSYTTREYARANKRPTEGIYDTLSGRWVR
jgi:hypothetical protein